MGQADQYDSDLLGPLHQRRALLPADSAGYCCKHVNFSLSKFLEVDVLIKLAGTTPFAWLRSLHCSLCLGGGLVLDSKSFPPPHDHAKLLYFAYQPRSKYTGPRTRDILQIVASEDIDEGIYSPEYTA